MLGRIVEFKDERTSSDTRDCDMRFRNLLSPDAWNALPAAVQRRFSKRIAAGDTVVYSGVVTKIVMGRVGRLLAAMLRVIGAPLPLYRDTGVATVVSVTEEGASGGQNWTRIYGRARGFPQVIHSTKRFAGITGIEEHIGYGITIALRICVEDGALVFRGAGYHVQIGRFRLPIPAALVPGHLTVTHREIDALSFLFTLNLSHEWFGTLIHQEAVYTEDVL